MSKVLEALVAIQGELKAPKDQNAGRYRYRNIEDINEAVKRLASKHGCAVVYTDRFIDGACVSTCRLLADDGEISADGVAYVNRTPKNMSVEQASGAASSYARKYAACGLFAIDSSENDPDKVNAQNVYEVKLDMAPSEYDIAKNRLWQSIKRYAELRGAIAQDIYNGLKESGGWEDSKEYYEAKACEFEEWCNEQRR